MKQKENKIMMIERREHERKEILADITVRRKSREFDAVAYNISPKGIHFVTTKKVSVGDTCLICLIKKKKNIIVLIKGTVRWIEQADNQKNMFKCGLVFKTEITDDELKQFQSNEK
jgi:hypothetical protein